MSQLQSKELNTVSGGEFDWKILPVAGGGGLLGAGLQWYRGAGLLSSQALLWGAGGTALGAAGYYGVQKALDYFSADA